MEILIDGHISSFCRNTVGLNGIGPYSKGPNSIGPNSIGLYNLSWPYNSPYNVLCRKPVANGYSDLLSDAFFSHATYKTRPDLLCKVSILRVFGSGLDLIGGS